MNINILRFDSVESTNTEAVRHARLGADEGLCIVARQQSAGRGRQGRVWISAKDAGLYFSIVLRPRFDPRSFPLITLMAGVAGYDLLREFGITPDIKWVNDLLVNDKKIGGVLAESTETPQGTAVICGIGVNLTSGSFPPEIAASATSVEAETGKRVAAEELCSALVRYLTYFYEILSGDDGTAEVLGHWRGRSSYFSDKPVRVTLQNDIFEGTTDGLEENGALRVKTLDGSVTIVQAGDVERLRRR